MPIIFFKSSRNTSSKGRGICGSYGTIRLKDKDLASLNEKQIAKVRNDKLGFVLYESIILITSDRKFSSEDMQMMLILAGLGLLAAMYQYMIYRLSLKKVGSLLQLN